MSMNCAEIDLVLEEINLPGSRIQKVQQPSYDTIVFECYGPGGKKDILISVASGACRIHGISRIPSKNERPLRFMECLKSHLKNGLVVSLRQLGSDRIVRMEVEGAEGTLIFYARLWSGAGNMLLVDSAGVVIDALLRKPRKSEASGMACIIEDSLAEASAEGQARRFEPRAFPGTASLSEGLDAHYASVGGSLSRERLLAQAQDRHERRMRFLSGRLSELEGQIAQAENADRFRQIGDILMAGYPANAGQGAADSGSFVHVHDFYEDKTVSIRIDPSLDHVANARNYYEKAKKAASGLEELRRERDRARESMEGQRRWLEEIKAEPDPFAVAKRLERNGTVRETRKDPYPCLAIDRDGWTILIGRSGKENDNLLRRHVKGSDLWLHVRDYAGSYVFIKARKGKSFPLDLLLDAGMLAFYYSKARKNGEGDIHYTFAKYLRRVRNGPTGLVIPSQEKNLRVALDEARIRALLENLIGGKE